MAEPRKETVRIALPPRPETASSPASAAVKHDTARIVLPPRTPVAPMRRLPPTITPQRSSDSPLESPTLAARRPPVTPLHLSPASPLLQPLPKPPGQEAIAESRVAAAPVRPARDDAAAQQPALGSVQQGPKNETARISVLPTPSPASKPSVNMTKTQPLLIRPAGDVQPAPLLISSKPLDAFELIPRSFCWGLFGIAALIFLIQIWNYVVS